MKAIRIAQFGGPDVMKLEETPDPVPGAGQVVVRLHAIGVNPVDTYVRAGKYGPKQFPYTPGADGAGVIEKVGEGVKDWKAGDRVYTAGSLSGTYAQLALCESAQVHCLPQRVSFEQGAAMGVPYATAYRGLFHRAAGKAGEWLLVHGASGGVGTAAVQLAKAAGLFIIGTAGTEDGRRLIKDEGAHHALDHRSADYLQQIMQITGGRGVDIILEMLANVNLGKDLSVLAKHGRVVVIGSRGKVEIDPRDTMGRDGDIRGMSLFNATAAELASIHSALVAGLENGTLRPIIGKRFPLADVARAHAEILEGAAKGKMILVV